MAANVTPSIIIAPFAEAVRYSPTPFPPDASDVPADRTADQLAVDAARTELLI